MECISQVWPKRRSFIYIRGFKKSNWLQSWWEHCQTKVDVDRGDGEGPPRGATWTKPGTWMACQVETSELCSWGHSLRHTQRSAMSPPLPWCSELPPELLTDWDFLLSSLPPPSFLPCLFFFLIFLEQGTLFFWCSLICLEKSIFKTKSKKLLIYGLLSLPL